MATLAMPVVVAEIGWVAMGLVDTLMVGPLGPEAIGAVGIGSARVLGRRHLCDGPVPGPRHPGVARVRSRPPRRLPPVAGARRRCSAWWYRFPSRSSARTVDFARQMGPGSRGLPIVAALSRCPRVERGAAPPVRDFPPLFAGHGRRAASDVRAGDGQRHQRDRQLDPHLWKLGAPAMGVRGSAWATVMSRVFHGGVSTGRDCPP